MPRSTLAAAWLLLCSTAFSQSQTPDVIPSNVEHRFAGTFDLATGVLTPPGSGSSELVVPALIYNNTCATGAFFSACNNGTVLIDDGRIPSPTSAAPYVGTKKSYRVVQFEIDYCTNELDTAFGGAGVTAKIQFFKDWDGCPQTLVDAGVPVASITVSGLPGSTAAGTLACNTVIISLTGGNEFCLRADTDGTYDGGGPVDGFGYSLSMLNQLSAAGGFTHAGESACAPGAGTNYLPPEGVPGTGLENDIDWHRTGAGGQTSGCFISVPTFNGFHMRIWAELAACGVCPDAGDPDADADGTPDCIDGCPNDPNKTSPGECGCGLPETDTDTDGIPDCTDNCDTIANPGQEDCDADGEGDACALAGGAPDCNGNARPDQCDIDLGSSLDGNINGIPDECENNVHFCFGDGTDGPCPCSNAGGTARGCENSATTGGAQLTTTGAPSLGVDTLVFTSSGERPTSLSVFLQGTSQIGAVNFGDGLRCFAGNLKRLYSKNAVGGVVSAPTGAEPSVSARSAALGDTIPNGGIRYYMVFYRDPSAAFCAEPTGGTFNASTARKITWGL